MSSNQTDLNDIKEPMSKLNLPDLVAVEVTASATNRDYVDAVLIEQRQYIPPDPPAEDLELSSGLIVEAVNDVGEAHESQVSDEFLSVSEDPSEGNLF